MRNLNIKYTYLQTLVYVLLGVLLFQVYFSKSSIEGVDMNLDDGMVYLVDAETRLDIDSAELKNGAFKMQFNYDMMKSNIRLRYTSATESRYLNFNVAQGEQQSALKSDLVLIMGKNLIQGSEIEKSPLDIIPVLLGYNSHNLAELD